MESRFRLLFGLLAALHARGFHAAVLAGLVMMPAVILAGLWSDRERSPAPLRQSITIEGLRGSFDTLAGPAPRS